MVASTHAYPANGSAFVAEDAMRAMVPSIFSAVASPKVSSKFAHITTNDVVVALAAKGFRPTYAGQSLKKDKGNMPFAKHTLRFRHENAVAETLKLGTLGVVPEIVLRNGHDGTSAYRLDAGLFRMVCANGLVIGDSRFGSIRIRHSLNQIGDVIEGTFRVIDEATKAVEVASKWSRIQMQVKQIEDFANEAAKLRLGDEGEAFNVLRSIEARRPEDRSNDLWTIFNRVQETVVRGGFRRDNREATNAWTGEGRRPARFVRTRELSAVDTTNKLNKQVWDLAESYAEKIAA